MTEATGNIVVGYSAAPAGLAALRMAAEESRLRHRPLHIVHQLVGDAAPFRYGPDSDFEAARRAAAPAIRAAVAETAPWIRDYELTLVTSPVADELVSASWTAELVVLGLTTSHAAVAVAFDTIPRAVLGRATCPVMLVPAHVRQAPRQLICGVDRSAESAAALTWAATDAGLRGVTLLAVDVAPPRRGKPTPRGDLTGWVQTQHPNAPTTVLCIEHRRHPTRLLLATAEGRQALLVVGAHDGDGHRWRRSVARQVSVQTRVPVVVMPPHLTEPEVGSPVKVAVSR